MNFFDIFIIYLACGAPFGVYFFVNHRKCQTYAFFKTVLISLFWIPFALGLLQRHVTKKLPTSNLSKKDNFRDEEILETKKNLESIFTNNKFDISIFELREILDRYIGLSEFVLIQDGTNETNSEFFEIAGNKNAGLAAKCYQRRNRKLLFFHHNLAGQDFLNTISEFVFRFPDNQEVEKISLKLAGLLNDEKTKKNLRSLFSKKQSRTETYVENMGEELWINDLQQPSAANALQISVNSASATINSSIKD